MAAITFRKTALAAALLIGVAATASTAPAAAAPASASTPITRPVSLPTTYRLPDGFRPEGIAIGKSPVAYFGSLADGDLVRVDLTSGKSEVLAQGPGTPSAGLKIDGRGRLFVAGGSAGNGRVVDTATGTTIAALTFTTATDTFVNDVVLTPSAAYFTDSRQPQLYRVALPQHRAPGRRDVTTIPLTGDITYTAEGNNANGITRTPDGKNLIIVQSTTGKLFTVDQKGVATQIRVTSDGAAHPLTDGDGLLRIGQTLFVVRNRLNTIVALTLNGRTAALSGTITDTRFDVPTTLAVYRDRLYTPNARFTTAPTPTTAYTAVSIPLP
ncbi:SMP-30/gluconolactonase/LRE family protein [Cryptosporangium sp. NPDC051539]|uniref:SMP-30/gluconolactonase/LRE family protein n=1 Tax=Cryptosporangium sp. NPDC051539 TaxID=3363962 RepID=UPI00379011DD